MGSLTVMRTIDWEARKKWLDYAERVPEKFRYTSLNTFIQDTPERKAAVDAVRAFIKDVKDGEFRALLLIGAPDTGKSHLACGILRECPGRYVLSTSLVHKDADLRAWHKDKASYAMWQQTLYYGDGVMAIGNIGDTNCPPHEARILPTVIAGLREIARPFVMTTSLSLDALYALIGKDILDTMQGKITTVELKDEFTPDEAGYAFT